MPIMKRTEMQFKTRSKVIQTKEGEALTFGFRLGPIAIFAIVNMPEELGKDGALVYIKMDLRVGEEWQEYSTESAPRKHL
jgi:hypothetical protein